MDTESLAAHERLLADVDDHPYSIPARLALARGYAALGYPDLAAGEAYMALLLTDEATDESGEYHDEVLEAAAVDGGGDTPESVSAWIAETISLDVYALLTTSLLACSNLKSVHKYTALGLAAHPSDPTLTSLAETIHTRAAAHLRRRGLDPEKYTAADYPDRGLVRRELYPWNAHEPDRFSPPSLALMNAQMTAVAPALEVRAVRLPVLAAGGTGEVTQLGVFARRDLAPGEEVFSELSLLTAALPLADALCDACSKRFPPLEEADDVVQCDECEVVFCSPGCRDAAWEAYHSAVCGADVDSVAKDAPREDAPDALYSLLLLRALAMAQARDMHPLELPEVRFIWGDFSLEGARCADEDAEAFAGRPRTLSFSFHLNVLLPLHILTKMDVNVFTTSRRFAPWVTNTLYAKFRGTASARQAPSGVPEVAAVHPLWCLANHACDPNVAWEWEGGMKLWVRREMVGWRRGEERRAPREAGIKEGEEVMSHYCDVFLPVKERREWAAGALGGMCLCDRCVWEAEGEEKSEGGVNGE
ncbi:hypothetical protein EJ06DRAFT_531008 [Trichodelitschia bisporula]|uniref:SET domain-containing protein n=1 Tax=Trichodelitschia bisporula TaxID=703511 RepID=A0A6G1HUG7_9PEZI|nr:hypothetical protein EJ06DRAFT_531008 [Trichodelitschia bisporula]